MTNRLDRVPAYQSVRYDEEARNHARVRSQTRRIGLAVAVAALGLAGCGSESSDTNTPTATAGTEGAQVEVGNTINYGSFGTTPNIDCADGKSLNVGGSNNTLTVKGTCANVNIGGADKPSPRGAGPKGLGAGVKTTSTHKRGETKTTATPAGTKRQERPTYLNFISILMIINGN